MDNPRPNSSLLQSDKKSEETEIFIMILVTSANGKTGRHVIAALVAKGFPVRALVHSQKGLALKQELGIQDIVVGDLLEPSVFKQAFRELSAG
jgi:uncharacterized protein YbjT (DUF2867 family)